MIKMETLANICGHYDIALVYLFGSRSKEAYRYLHGHKIEIDDPLADIDVGVVFSKDLSVSGVRYKIYTDISNDFADLFEPFPVDLSLLGENHSIFQLEAIKGECAYYVDINQKEDYEEMILRRAADFKPVLDLFLKETLEEI